MGEERLLIDFIRRREEVKGAKGWWGLLRFLCTPGLRLLAKPLFHGAPGFFEKSGLTVSLQMLFAAPSAIGKKGVRLMNIAQ